MKEIPLTQNKFALIDDEDYEKVSDLVWHFTDKGYARAHDPVSGRSVLMHRVIMNTPTGMETDHVNGNRIDNRKENLRVCTSSENRINSHKRNNCSSTYKGVNWDKFHKQWVAKLKVDGKQRLIGYFNEEYQAAMAYDIWARELHGEFARLNFVPAI